MRFFRSKLHQTLLKRIHTDMQMPNGYHMYYVCIDVDLPTLHVRSFGISNGQLISRPNFLLSLEPKSEQNYFLISAPRI